jgi:hypothetical protein
MSEQDPNLTPEQWAIVNQAASWDDRKELSDLWQRYAPLPEIGLREGVYDALIAVARYGAVRAVREVTDGPDAR